MSFPREEDLGELIGDAEYVEAGIRWRVFQELDPLLPGRKVLIVLGDKWTMLDGEAFRRLADRILPQL